MKESVQEVQHLAIRKPERHEKGRQQEGKELSNGLKEHFSG